MSLYLDSSAAWKLIASEEHSSALRNFVADQDIASSRLIQVELMHNAGRLQVPFDRVGQLLEMLNYIEIDQQIMRLAMFIAGDGLKSLDAIHIACAAASDAETFVSYDRQQARFAVERMGMAVLSPGAE